MLFVYLLPVIKKQQLPVLICLKMAVSPNSCFSRLYPTFFTRAPPPTGGCFEAHQGEGCKGRHCLPHPRAVVQRSKSEIALPRPELASPRLESLFFPPFQMPTLVGRPLGSQPWLGPTSASICPVHSCSVLGAVCDKRLSSQPDRDDK